MKTQLPISFKPLLWSLRWEDIDVEEDKHDIIINTLNEGTMEQWHWLADTYGRQTIRDVLREHLPSELHSESRNLAEVLFSPITYHAPRNIDGGGAGIGSWPRRI